MEKNEVISEDSLLAMIDEEMTEAAARFWAEEVIRISEAEGKKAAELSSHPAACDLDSSSHEAEELGQEKVEDDEHDAMMERIWRGQLGEWGGLTTIEVDGAVLPAYEIENLAGEKFALFLEHAGWSLAKWEDIGDQQWFWDSILCSHMTDAKEAKIWAEDTIKGLAK